MTMERPGEDEVRRRIQSFLQSSGLAAPDARIALLTGDASDRRYFRIHVPGGSSLVLAVHAGPVTFEGSPFDQVHRLLGRIPIPVPRVLGHSDELGIVALEDLGDVTLQDRLVEVDPTERAALYRKAVTLLATLQREGGALASSGYIPYSIAFDVEKLTWELDYFRTHFLEGHRGARLTPGVQEQLARQFAAIAEELAAEPRVLCHRDYHSRNLMHHDRRLYVIDFQDARMGPDTYDLVSLLRDSYVGLAADHVNALIAFFLRERRAEAHSGPDKLEFRRRFDLMALQRNLKALGTFGFQAVSRSNPAYLQYIPRTLSYARATLVANPRFSQLHGLLAEHLTELR